MTPVKYLKCNIIGYAENFEIKYESTRWVIDIKIGLDNDFLKENSELVMTLTAKEAENENTGEATLILKLPTVDNQTGPKFSKAYYTAYYPEEGTGVAGFEPSLEFSNVDNPEDIVIALDSK